MPSNALESNYGSPRDPTGIEGGVGSVPVPITKKAKRRRLLNGKEEESLGNPGRWDCNVAFDAGTPFPPQITESTAIP